MSDVWTNDDEWTVSDGKKIVVHRRKMATPEARSFAYAKEECFPTTDRLPDETRVMAEKGTQLTAENIPPEAKTYPGGKEAFSAQFAGKGYYRVRIVFRNAEALTEVSSIRGAGYEFEWEPVYGEGEALRNAKLTNWARAFLPSAVARDAWDYVQNSKTLEDLYGPGFIHFLQVRGLGTFGVWRLFDFMAKWAKGKVREGHKATVEECRKLIGPALRDYASRADTVQFWKFDIATADDYVCTTNNDCSSTAGIFTGTKLGSLPDLRDQAGKRLVVPEIGKGIWLNFETGVDYGWDSHYSTVFLVDDKDFLCYETASSRVVPTLPTRGTGYFEIYRAEENHARRFFWMVLEKAEQNVGINAGLDLRYVTGGHQYSSSLLTEPEQEALTGEIQRQRATEIGKLDRLKSHA